MHARVARARAQPAHQRRRVGREEEVAGRVERDAAAAGRVQAHAGDRAHDRRGERRDRLDRRERFLDDDAGRVEPLARIALALDERDIRTGARRGDGARDAGEARADDQDIVTRRHAPAGQSSGRNRSVSARWNCSGRSGRGSGLDFRIARCTASS